MTTATLGGIIKDYRIKKRLSQLDISLRIGWKDTTRLSKIEQGRVAKPSRETVDKIIKALELTEQEKGELLLHGGYVPTDKENSYVIETVKHKILSWQYPAYLMDFSWRILLINQATIDVFGFPQALLKTAYKVKPNLLENVAMDWKIEIFKGDDEKTLRPLEETLVAQFKVEHLGHENDKWYKQIITKLAASEKFRKLWSTIDAKDYHKKLFEYEYKVVRWPKTGKIKTYHVFDSKLVFDRRFIVVLYLPADK